MIRPRSRRESLRWGETRKSSGWFAIQQAACQPSGKGISGHSAPLSLAAVEGRREAAMAATKSRRGIGAIAAFTASSIRSNSASLMALSGIRTPNVAKVPFFVIELTAQIVIDPVNAVGLVDES